MTPHSPSPAPAHAKDPPAMAIGFGARELFRDFNDEATGAASGKYRPEKAKIRPWGTRLDWLLQLPTTGGTGAAYTYTSVADITTPLSTLAVDKVVIGVRAHIGCSAGATFNPDGLGAKAIKLAGANLGLRAIENGEMAVNGIYFLQRDTGNDCWILLNPNANTIYGNSNTNVQTPAHSFEGDDDTGLGRMAANSCGISAGGVRATSWVSNGLGVGKLATDAIGVVGAILTVNGACNLTVDAGACLAVNRLTDDGNLVQFHQAGTLEGAISVSGATVSYGSFSGFHWSQGVPELLVGTVLDSLDEMCSWEGEGNLHLPKCEVSSRFGSAAVYGVFRQLDKDGDVEVLSLGTGLVRCEAPSILKRGDLLISAGNGCATAAPDDIIRSNVIGKVLSSHKAIIHPDGSYCLPCVLYCG